MRFERTGWIPSTRFLNRASQVRILPGALPGALRIPSARNAGAFATADPNHGTIDVMLRGNGPCGRDFTARFLRMAALGGTAFFNRSRMTAKSIGY
jgi:hypothetical protein